MSFLNFVWNDPVFSKVIAAGIIFILSQAIAIVYAFFRRITFFQVYVNLFKKIKDLLAITKRKTTKETQKNKIDVHPNVFFYHRMCDAFPGLNGYQEFTNKKEIYHRLKTLLRHPLCFDETEGFCTVDDPIWWFRDTQALYIKNFTKIKSRVFLMDDIYELDVKRIIAYKDDCYWRNFVYIETYPQKPIGVYPLLTEKGIIKQVKELGRCKEEYGIKGRHLLTREEFDDKAKVIKGKPVDMSGAKLRVRYLADYNFIIAGKLSPFNSKDFENKSLEYLEGVIKKSITIDDFISWMRSLPRIDT